MVCRLCVVMWGVISNSHFRPAPLSTRICITKSIQLSRLRSWSFCSRAVYFSKSTQLIRHTTAVITGCDPESLCVSLRQAVRLYCLRVVCSESDRSAQCAVDRIFVRSCQTFILFKRVLFVTPLGKALIRLASVDSAEEVRTRSEGLNLVNPLWRVEQRSYHRRFVVSLVQIYEYRISETPRATVREEVHQNPVNQSGTSTSNQWRQNTTIRSRPLTLYLSLE